MNLENPRLKKLLISLLIIFLIAFIAVVTLIITKKNQTKTQANPVSQEKQLPPKEQFKEVSDPVVRKDLEGIEEARQQQETQNAPQVDQKQQEVIQTQTNTLDQLRNQVDSNPTPPANPQEAKAQLDALDALREKSK